jgi:hypothetical protein
MFGLDVKSLVIGGALGMFVVPRIIALVSSRTSGGAAK